jgi:hypothetical protein
VTLAEAVSVGKTLKLADAVAATLPVMLGVAERVASAVIVDEAAALGDTDADGVAAPVTLNDAETLTVTDTDPDTESVALRDAVIDAVTLAERVAVWVVTTLDEALKLADAVAETVSVMLGVAEWVATADTDADAVTLSDTGAGVALSCSEFERDGEKELELALSCDADGIRDALAGRDGDALAVALLETLSEADCEELGDEASVGQMARMRLLPLSTM